MIGWCHWSRPEASMLSRDKTLQVPTFVEKSLQAQHPGDDLLGDKAQHSKSQHEKKHKGAEPAGFGLFGKVPDDKQHEQHETAQAESETEFGNLLFC